MLLIHFQEIECWQAAAFRLKRPSVLINEHTAEDTGWRLLENKLLGKETILY